MENPLSCFHFSWGQTDGQHLALGRRQPSPTQALRPRTRSSNHASLRGFSAAVGRKAWRREPEGHKVGTQWRRKALRTQVQRRRRPGGLPCPGQDRRSGGCGPRRCGPRWRGRAGSEPTGPHCSPVTLPLALLPLSNTLLSGFLLSPFQRCCLLFPSLPGCFHFFCLKFLRGRFYFQRFD